MMSARRLLWLAVLVPALLAPLGALQSAQAQDKSPQDKSPKADPKKVESKAEKSVLAPSLPRTPAERDGVLAELYERLAIADDEAAAKAVEASLERVWMHSGSATVDLLFQRAMQAVSQKDYDRALVFLTHVVEQAPDFTEAWNRRAFVHFQRNDVGLALGDLRRALALDPSNYRALDGLAQVLRDIGEKQAALEVLRRLHEVHPHWPGAEKAVEELSREVEGQPL
jgi:tetratricopeptide (TPR) repeat protein